MITQDLGSCGGLCTSTNHVITSSKNESFLMKMPLDKKLNQDLSSATSFVFKIDPVRECQFYQSFMIS
jgi:hypothetical protein